MSKLNFIIVDMYTCMLTSPWWKFEIWSPFFSSLTCTWL